MKNKKVNMKLFFVTVDCFMLILCFISFFYFVFRGTLFYRILWVGSGTYCMISFLLWLKRTDKGGR